MKGLQESATGAWQLGLTISLDAAPLYLSTQSKVNLKKLANPEFKAEVSKRPDLIFYLKQIAVLLGEYKLNSMPTAISDLLIYSSGVHSAEFYGGVPYILACAASGSAIQFFVIYPTGVRALADKLFAENITSYYRCSPLFKSFPHLTYGI